MCQINVFYFILLYASIEFILSQNLNQEVSIILWVLENNIGDWSYFQKLPFFSFPTVFQHFVCIAFFKIKI